MSPRRYAFLISRSESTEEYLNLVGSFLSFSLFRLLFFALDLGIFDLFFFRALYFSVSSLLDFSS